MKELDIQIPEKLLPLWTTKKRYIVIKGGRGSGKSWGVADFLIVKGYLEPKRILCTREIQKSIKDSVHKLLVDTIYKHGLESFYHITERSIVGKNGTEFIFKGLAFNSSDIKSTEGIDYCWVEEGENTSRKSLNILSPTIRKENSQIIFVYNPYMEYDPIHTDFALADRDDTLVIEINYKDNEWFPEVLRDELEYDKRTNFDKYCHKWLGQCLQHSEAQVFFGKWIVEEFNTHEDVDFNFGADFGYSNDPSTAVRNYVHENILYIQYDVWQVGCELDNLPALFNRIPKMKDNISVGDYARPETISHINKYGFKMVSSKKGKGSITFGIERIKSFDKIIIHPRCEKSIEEFRNYKYKVDVKTNKISNVPEDKNNHIIDAIRYSLEGIDNKPEVVRYERNVKSQHSF